MQQPWDTHSQSLYHLVELLHTLNQKQEKRVEKQQQQKLNQQTTYGRVGYGTSLHQSSCISCFGQGVTLCQGLLVSQESCCRRQLVNVVTVLHLQGLLTLVVVLMRRFQHYHNKGRSMRNVPYLHHSFNSQFIVVLNPCSLYLLPTTVRTTKYHF